MVCHTFLAGDLQSPKLPKTLNSHPASGGRLHPDTGDAQQALHFRPGLGTGEHNTVDGQMHYLKDPKLWELRYIPYFGSCRILTINRRSLGFRV